MLTERTDRLVQLFEHENGLLQTYRSYHLTFQTLWLATAAALATFLFSCKPDADARAIAACSLLLRILEVMGVVFLIGMGWVISDKAKDVKYWQTKVEEDEFDQAKVELRVVRGFLMDRRYEGLTDAEKEVGMTQRVRPPKPMSYKVFTTRGVLWFLLILGFWLAWGALVIFVEYFLF